MSRLILPSEWSLTIVTRTRVKICGITSAVDARKAVDAGADAIGLVFYDASPRAVSLDQAREICLAIPPFVSIVALTVDAPRQKLENIIEALPVSLLQFHGDESSDFCESFKLPYIKALRMSEDADIAEQLERYASAKALLLDAYRKGVPGGTGEVFDWQRIPQALSQRIILAGGLNGANVADAIASVGPYAVDVSGGVEASPGVKDGDRIIEFIGSVARADCLEK